MSVNNQKVESTNSSDSMYSNDFKSNISYGTYIRSKSKKDKKAFYEELDLRIKEKTVAILG